MDIIEFVLSEGAHKAGIVDVADIPFDEGLRPYCEANYCGNFGKNHTCPPNVGSIDKLIEKARQYKSMVLFQTIGEYEDSFDFEGMERAGDYHKLLTLRIRDGLDLPGSMVLSAGGCSVCPQCAAITSEQCRFPDKAIASLESYGINVSITASLASMNYINGPNTVTYFSGIFF